jgi:spore germination cell wall hydrolase CwlJ-like protein
MTQGGIILLLAALSAHGHQVRTEKAEVTCMAQALYYEARGEGQNGQEAVAEVILQRVRSGGRPDTICGVVREPRQFSFLTDGSTLRELDADAWQSAKQLAARIVRGEVVTSLTRRAQFYHQVDIQPAWASEMVRTAKIGNHVFYRLPGRIRDEGRATQVRLTVQPVHGASSKPRSA